MGRYFGAFLDGVVTGVDVYGAIYGHIKGGSHFLGYQADVYSVATPSSEIPKQRDVLEQVAKGLGDIVGLLALGGISGVSHLVCRAIDSPERRRITMLDDPKAADNMWRS